MGVEREKEGGAACLRDGLAAAQHECRALRACRAAALAEARAPPERPVAQPGQAVRGHAVRGIRAAVQAAAAQSARGHGVRAPAGPPP